MTEERRRAEALAAVQLLRASRHRRQHLLVAYRCDGRGGHRRCLLAEVYGTPGGPVLFLPGDRAHPAFTQPADGQRYPDRARFVRHEDSLVEADRTGSGQRAVLAATPEPRPLSRHDDEDPWLTTGDAADVLGLSTSYLRRLARRGHPAAKPSHDGWLWHREQLPTPGTRRAS